MRSDVDFTPGVGVVPPCATRARGLLEDREGIDSGASQLDGRCNAAEPSADDRDPWPSLRHSSHSSHYPSTSSALELLQSRSLASKNYAGTAELEVPVVRRDRTQASRHSPHRVIERASVLTLRMMLAAGLLRTWRHPAPAHRFGTPGSPMRVASARIGRVRWWTSGTPAVHRCHARARIRWRAPRANRPL